MLPAICAFVLSVSTFGPDSVESHVALLQENICEFFSEQDTVVNVVTGPDEVETAVTDTEASEVVGVEPNVIEDESIEPNLSPEVMPEAEIAEPAATAPAFDVTDDETVVESVEDGIAEENIAGHVSAVVGEAVAEVSATHESETIEFSEIEEVLGAWPQLSEETRLSILTLIRIDNSVE